MKGEEIKAALGANIKKIRTLRRFTQAELSERADISIIYLSNIERGIKFPKPAILSQIAEALEIEVYELFKSNYSPSTIPKNNNKLINSLSKEMNKKVLLAMDGVFKHYLR